MTTSFSFFSRALRFSLSLAACLAAARASDLAALWAERVSCTAAVEFYAETETERRENTSFGTVIDERGTIILPPQAINLRFAPDQLKGFKVFYPGDAVGCPGEYLGVDALTGWHFVRAGEALRGRFKPVTRFAKKAAQPPGLAEDIWGIGLRGKEEDFLPYLMTSRVAMLNSLPQRTGISQHEVAAPGLPVFDNAGDFIGVGLSSFGQSFIEFSRNERGGSPVMLVNLEESSAFLLAEEVLPYFGRVPKNLFGRPLAWLGTYGLQPVDPEVARFIKLENQSAAVVSEVLDGSPAEAAGLKERDIIVAVNGKPLPRFKPDRVVTTFIDREVDRCLPGDPFSLTVLRDGKRIEAKAILADAPRLSREAPRRYFERVGLSAREFVYSDAVMRRVKASESTGVIAHFVKPSGPAGSAGLQTDDWIKEIDAVEVKTYAQAVERLAVIEGDLMRSEFVLLVSRGGETSVLRVKLK
ncbi:MAG: PDZ domain-containing protein [Opitutaceae bacterium]|jgi:serine protease Do